MSANSHDTRCLAIRSGLSGLKEEVHTLVRPTHTPVTVLELPLANALTEILQYPVETVLVMDVSLPHAYYLAGRSNAPE